jgi:hypothetical protein
VSSSRIGRIEYGGPDLPARRLRDLLQDHVDASPSGSRIDWATYYFRDRDLAAALIRASDRGVRVRLALDSAPRRKDANDAVIDILSAHGLNGGLALRRPLRGQRGRLHAKVYAFSDPAIAWIGSFNPSGDSIHNPDIIAEIGDQDRGHNLLLGLEQPKLLKTLQRHVRRLAVERPGRLDRFRPSFNRPVYGDGAALYFYPRLRTKLIEAEVDRLRPGDAVRAAVSHMQTGAFTESLRAAAKRNVAVTLLVHDTERRVASDLVQDLTDWGIDVRRIRHPDDLPMHAKFVILQGKGGACAWLGSYNFNRRASRKNAEILARIEDRPLIDSLQSRFEKIAAMA